MDVTEDPEFDGTISTIRKEFNFMARRYVERLFNEHLVPKFVCGRKVRGRPWRVLQFLVCVCVSVDVRVQV